MVPVPGYLDFELARLRTNYLPVLAAVGLNRERSQSRHRVPQAAQLVCEIVSTNTWTNPPTMMNKPINRRSRNGVMGECLRR